MSCDCRAGRLWVLLLVLAVVLTGCSSPDPEERFVAAFEATFADSFAFTVSLEADQAALADLGDSAGGAAAFLSGIRLTGVVDGDDTRLVLEALGGSIVEVRQVGAGGDPDAAFYLRAGIVDLLAQVGVDQFEAEDALIEELTAQGASPAVLQAIRDGFDGGWVGLAGGLGATLGSAAREAGAVDDARTAFGTDVRGFLDRYVEVTAFDSGVLRAGLRLGDLLRAAAGVGDSLPVGPDFSPEDLETDLANLPEVVAGDVLVEDGRLQELAFDVAQAARAFGQEVTGQIVVRVTFTDHGEAGPVQRPDGVEPLDSAVLDEAVAAILGALGVG